MTVVVKINIKKSNIKKMFADPKGPVARGMLKSAKKVERKAKRLVNVDKGLLRASITSEVAYRGGIPIGRVGTKVKYAIYIHEGTGIYGPRGIPITPKKGKYLAFQPKGSKKTIYVKSVRGIKPNPFLRDALKVLAA